MFKLAQYILDHKEISAAQVPTIKNFGGEVPVYKCIKNVPTSKAIDMLSAEWLNRPPVYPNVRKEVHQPIVKTAEGYPDYLRYVLGHKYNVFASGVKAGIDPVTLVKHDYSKFEPEAFDAYSEAFFGPQGMKGTKSPRVIKAFRKEVQEHYESEPHHNDKIGLSKPVDTEIESLCDWYSVGKTNADMQGKPFPSFVEWWNEKKYYFLSNGKISEEAYNKLNAAISKDFNLWTYTVDQIRKLF